MNNSKGFKMKSAYGSGLKQTGKMEAVGSMARRAQYDKLGWAYDETIPVQGPLKGREARPPTRSSKAPKKEIKATKKAGLKELRTEKIGARKNAKSIKKVSRLEGKLEAAKKAKK